jgi:hypothetical protein
VLWDHWSGCPLPPDAGCKPCHEFARRYVRQCSCTPGGGCDENYDEDDIRRCIYCSLLDGELPCPAEEVMVDAD